MIRPATPADAEPITAIYNHYIFHSISTFEEHPITPFELAQRMANIVQAGLPYLVAEQDNRVLGYAYAGRWGARSAYRFSAETSVYLAHDVHGQGLGTQLYQHLLALLKTAGFHVAIGGISLPNAASVALHEKLGYQKAAHYKEVGYKFEQWIDVGYWQKFL